MREREIAYTDFSERKKYSGYNTGTAAYDINFEKKIQEENKQKWESMTIEEHMEYYISQGNDKKSAMKLVAKDRGVSKREIYAYLNKD